VRRFIGDSRHSQGLPMIVAGARGRHEFHERWRCR